MQSTGQSFFLPNSASTLATGYAHDTTFPHNLTDGPAPPLIPGQLFPAHHIHQAASRLPSAPGKAHRSRQASLRPALRQRVSSPATTISSGTDHPRIVPSARRPIESSFSGYAIASIVQRFRDATPCRALAPLPKRRDLAVPVPHSSPRGPNPALIGKSASVTGGRDAANSNRSSSSTPTTLTPGRLSTTPS